MSIVAIVSIIKITTKIIFIILITSYVSNPTIVNKIDLSFFLSFIKKQLKIYLNRGKKGIILKKKMGNIIWEEKYMKKGRTVSRKAYHMYDCSSWSCLFIA
jgi:hypothetical protein